MTHVQALWREDRGGASPRAAQLEAVRHQAMKLPSTPNTPQPDWADAVDFIRPFVFRVEAGDFGGSAFLIAFGRPKTGGDPDTLMFATARHVTMPSGQIPATLRLISHDASTTLTSTSHRCFAYALGPAEFDIGLIIVDTLPPDHLLEIPPLLPHSRKVRQGADLGWLGYPGLAGSKLSFFSGVLSSYLDHPPGYLADGVAINGVSGGPAFTREGHIVGIVSSYRPNWLGKTTALPGLVTLISVGFIDYWMDQVLTQEIRPTA